LHSYLHQVNTVNWWSYCFLCALSEPVNQTVAALNANRFKMVKATDFIFDAHVSRDIPYNIVSNIFRKGGVTRVM